MTIFLAIIGIALILFGITIDRLWIHLKRKEPNPVNMIPLNEIKLNESETNMLEIYMQEWQTIIKTQMHFNDLILRFRSITLTVFIALIGAAITIKKIAPSSDLDLILLLLLCAVFWLTSFIIDYCYYHRLLLGSVKQALKFDNSDKFRALGLFGMSACISEHVHPQTSKYLIFLYYSLPFILIVILLLWRLKI